VQLAPWLVPAGSWRISVFRQSLSRAARSAVAGCPPQVVISPDLK